MESVKQAGTFSEAQLSRMSIVEESSPKRIRMANLAIISSHHVNGVAAIHTDILKEQVFNDFYTLWPAKFVNITNGVTPRRWLRQCNSALANVITKHLHSEEWIVNLDLLAELRRNVTPGLLDDVAEAKMKNKLRLCKLVKQTNNIDLDPTALFDVHIKRIHEYKRQLLNVLGVVHRYLAIKRMTPDQRKKVVKKVVIFAGKAAPGYDIAKMVIKLINCIAATINADRSINDLLKVVFLANYNVSMAEILIPASDLSQHISTAGTEASGTSNMKFAMNGGLLLGTLDGANIEILQEVGKDNIFIFGLTKKEVEQYRSSGSTLIDERLFDVLRTIQDGSVCPADHFHPLIDPLFRGNDFYLLAQDFPLYVDAMARVDEAWKDRAEWNLRCLRSISATGRFSSDRTIHEYAKIIWGITPCKYEARQSDV
jgi:starch phosphorylase